jgi:hypothetical protein
MDGAMMTNMSTNDNNLDAAQQGMRVPTTTRVGLTPQAEQQIIRAMDKNKFNTILIASRSRLHPDSITMLYLPAPCASTRKLNN